MVHVTPETHRGPSQTGSAHAWLPIAVGLLAIAVAGWKIWVPGMWHDEVATLVAADRSLGSLARMLREVDAVHGLYYALMNGWVNLAGTSAFALRLPSTLAVGGTAAVMTALGQREWGPVAGTVAGLASVAIPRSLWLATEARSYAIATFLVALMVYTFWRALQQTRLGWWAAYAGVAGLAILAFMYSVLVLPALAMAAWAVGWGERQGRRFWVATAAAGLAGSPMVLMAITQRQQVGWLTPVLLSRLRQELGSAFLTGTKSGLVNVWWVFLGSCALTWLVAIRRQGRRERGLFVLATGWLAIPLTALLTVSLVVPLWTPRYGSICVPALALFVAGAVAALRARVWQAIVVSVILALLACQSWHAHRLPNAKDTLLDVAAIVSQVRQPGDVVWFVARPAGSDRTPRIVRYAYPEAFTGMADLTLDRPFEDSGTLFETEKPLTEVQQQLAGVDRLVGVMYWPADFSEDFAEADLAKLAQSGLVETDHRVAGRWTVIVMERA